MDIFIKVLLVLACVVAVIFVFSYAVEIYFNRKEKFFVKQIQIAGTVIGQAADTVLKKMDEQKKESK